MGFLSQIWKRRTKEPVDPAVGWDSYVDGWRGEGILGDEWDGKKAGLAGSDEQKRIVREKFIEPYFSERTRIIEFGAGAGKWTGYLVDTGAHVCAVDVSPKMQALLKQKFGETVACELIDPQRSVSDLPADSYDGLFSYDCFVHIEVNDILHYMQTLNRVLASGAICVAHLSNTLSERGWRAFERTCWVNARKPYTAHAVNTPDLMRKIIEETGYELILQDTTTVPRDCVSVFRKT